MNAPATKARGGRKARWTSAAVIEKIQEWNRLYGEPPVTADWNPSLARWRCQEFRIARYRAGDWPSVNAAKAPFDGSFDTAVRAAGLVPHRPGPRRRAPFEASPDLPQRGPLPPVQVEDELRAAAERVKGAEERVAFERKRTERAVARAEKAEGRIRDARERARKATDAKRRAQRTRDKAKTNEKQVKLSALTRAERRVVEAEARATSATDQASAAVRDADSAILARQEAVAAVERMEADVAAADAQVAEETRRANVAEDRAGVAEREMAVAVEEASRVSLKASESAAVASAQGRARKAELATAAAERRMRELGALVTGEDRMLTPAEVRGLREGGPSGAAVLAPALKALAAARAEGGREPLKAALYRVASAAIRWRDSL